MREITVGIIGFGNMGSAIYERLKGSCNFKVFDKEVGKISGLSAENVADSLRDLISQSGIIILAVKPQDFDTVLNDIKNYVKGQLIISIAAGITTAYIEKYLGNVRVIRVMPNMPAKIGQGMSCLCKGKFASAADLSFAQRLFRELGETLILSEDMMDAATAISGSGPGYFYDLIQGKRPEEAENYARDVFIPQLIKAAEGIGFNPKQADLLARATVEGSVVLLKETGLSLESLRDQVASKGGTTEAGLQVLHNGGSLQEAAKAALKRATELSRR